MDIFLYDCQIITKKKSSLASDEWRFDFSLVGNSLPAAFEAMFMIEDNKIWWPVINIWWLSQVIFMNWNYKRDYFFDRNKLLGQQIYQMFWLNEYILTNVGQAFRQTICDISWANIKWPKINIQDEEERKNIQNFINHRWTVREMFWIELTCLQYPLNLEFPILELWLTMCNIFHHIIHNTFRPIFIALMLFSF